MEQRTSATSRAEKVLNNVTANLPGNACRPSREKETFGPLSLQYSYLHIDSQIAIIVLIYCSNFPKY